MRTCNATRNLAHAALDAGEALIADPTTRDVNTQDTAADVLNKSTAQQILNTTWYAITIGRNTNRTRGHALT